MQKLEQRSTDMPAEIVSSLVSSGHALVQPETEIQPLIDIIIKYFLELITLPAAERAKWQIDAEGMGDPDDGLIERNGGQHDHKFFFHCRSLELMLVHLQRQGVDCTYWHPFLESLAALHQSLLLKTHTVAATLCDRYQEYGLVSYINNQEPLTRGVLRILYYKPGYTVFANPHFDVSLLSCHVADSHPGLVLGIKNERAKNIYIPKKNELLLFPGMKAEIITDDECSTFGTSRALDPNWNPNSLLPAAYHSAIANEKSMDEGRWAIVFFYHCNVGFGTDLVSKIAKAQMKKLLASVT